MIKFIFFNFLLLTTFSSHFQSAECGNKVVLDKTIESSSSQNPNGKVFVNIITDKSFTATLYRLAVNGDVLVTSKKGNGNSNISFQGLANNKSYKVGVDFANENNTDCKSFSILITSLK